MTSVPHGNLRSVVPILSAERFCGGMWTTRQTSLPAATFAGIIERLELISSALIAEPEAFLYF
jgi:hypothetical protein